MVPLFQCGVSKPGIAGLMDMLMVQGVASTESKSPSSALKSILSPIDCRIEICR